MPEGGSHVLKAKETSFSSRYGMSLFTFLFLGKFDNFLLNLMPTRGVEL
jgi:hypothetical protein